MRLKYSTIKIIILVSHILCPIFVSAQKKLTKEERIRNRLVYTIDSSVSKSFENYTYDSSNMVEQAAIIQFVLKNGVVDTFLIWSTQEKAVSNWFIRYVKQTIGKKLPNAERYSFILLPLATYDYYSERKEFAYPDDLEMIDKLMSFDIKTTNKKLLILRGYPLTCYWHKSGRKEGHSLPASTITYPQNDVKKE
jgi:hypothetical protein